MSIDDFLENETLKEEYYFTFSTYFYTQTPTFGAMIPSSFDLEWTEHTHIRPIFKLDYLEDEMLNKKDLFFIFNLVLLTQ